MTGANRSTPLIVAFVVLAIVCAVLYAPAVHVGFLADDLFQISMLEGRFGPYSVAHLYAFAPEDPQSTALHVQRGSLPWWTHPHFRFVMVRPLSSLLLSFDHWVFPRQGVAHHLHSALWFVAVLAAAFALLRDVGSRWFAFAGVALFSIDETMTWMVAWLANRCALVCTVFALLALLVHVRSARSGQVSWRAHGLELVLWAAAFAGGEYAVGGVAYLGAFALLGDTRSWRTRAWSLLPAAIALLAFVITYFILGGGVYGGTTYVDPFAETPRFVEAATHRVPRMLGEVWTNFAGESDHFWIRYEGSGLSQWVMPREISDLETIAYRHGAFAVVSSIALVVPAWWLARRYWSAQERRTIRWLVLGSLLSLLPIAAIPPATRALMLPNLGAAVFFGGVVVAGGRAWRNGVGHLVLRVILSVWAIVATYVHGVRECEYVGQQLDALLGAQASYARFYQNDELAALDLEDKHVVVIATSGLVTGIHGVSMLHVFGMTPPRTWHVLGMGPRPYTLRTLGPRKLELGSVGGPMHVTPQEVLFRSHNDALLNGDTVEAGLFVAEVVHDRGGKGPGTVTFRFRWPLDDPRIVFLEVGPNGLRPFATPKPGSMIVIPPPQLPKGNASD